MALGICGICTETQAKYKCPACGVAYCSLTCFKSAKHAHDAGATPARAARPTLAPGEKPNEPLSAALFAEIARDPVVASLLQYKALQVHLAILLKLLLDSLLTREPIYENRREIVNMRLCDLRIGGAEENELIEEFVQRVLFLHGRGPSLA